MVRVFFDGGCTKRGVISACVVALRGASADVLAGVTGRGDAYDAEWLALLNAVAVARRLPAACVHLMGDNLSVIEAVDDRLPVRGSRARRYRLAFGEATAGFEEVSCEWVPRRLNLAGRYLEGGANDWFLSGLRMLEGVEEFRLLPLPQTLHPPSMTCHDAPLEPSFSPRGA